MMGEGGWLYIEGGGKRMVGEMINTMREQVNIHIMR